MIMTMMMIIMLMTVILITLLPAQLLEEEVVETHKNLLDNMEHWLQQDASLLAMTNEVDYDQDGEQNITENYENTALWLNKADQRPLDFD